MDMYSLQSARFKFKLSCYRLGFGKQKLFNQGQMYVALSHVTDIKNLHLIGTYNQNAFPVNSYVTSEYDRLQESSYFIPCSTLNMNSSSLTVSLLNTRSLRGHLQDVVKDKNLVENNPWCLTEIQVCHENDISDIEEQ